MAPKIKAKLIPESDSEVDLDSGDENAKGAVSAPYLSRGQKKRAERKESWLRKNNWTEYVKKAKQSVVDDFKLGGVKNSLADLQKQIEEEDSKKKDAKQQTNISRKARENQIKRDQDKFESIANFPVFQQDPFVALQTHLANTLKKQDASLKEATKTSKAEKTKKQ